MGKTIIIITMHNSIQFAKYFDLLQIQTASVIKFTYFKSFAVFKPARIIIQKRNWITLIFIHIMPTYTKQSYKGKRFRVKIFHLVVEICAQISTINDFILWLRLRLRLLASYIFYFSGDLRFVDITSLYFSILNFIDVLIIE